MSLTFVNYQFSCLHAC